MIPLSSGVISLEEKSLTQKETLEQLLSRREYLAESVPLIREMAESIF